MLKGLKPSNLRFAKCIPSCTPEMLRPSLYHSLESLAIFCNHVLVINSAYRSSDWEKSHGRSGTSSHCLGYAVDIACTSSKFRENLLRNAVLCGFRRIGVAKTFIHLDTDPLKPFAVWVY